LKNSINAAAILFKKVPVGLFDISETSALWILK